MNEDYTNKKSIVDKLLSLIDTLLPWGIVFFTLLGIGMALWIEKSPVSVFFSGFSGLAIYFIWDYVKKDEDLRVKNYYGEEEWGLLYLASALFLWVLSSDFTFFFEIMKNEGETDKSIEYYDNLSYYVSSIISTGNSTLLLLTIRDFYIRDPRGWIKTIRNSWWFSKRIILIMTGVLVFVLSSIIYATIPYNGKEPFLWVSFPDFILSVPTIVFLWIFLKELFEQRKLPLFNYLVFVSLILTFIAQVIAIYPSFMEKIQSLLGWNDDIHDDIGGFIKISYRISLISIFFAISYSWIESVRRDDRYKKLKKVSKTNKELATKKRAMNHMIRGTLRDLSLDLRYYHNKYEKLQEARSRIDSMLALHDIVHKEENTTEIDLKEYIEQICKRVVCEIHNYNCKDNTIKIDTDIFCKVKHARDLSTIIIELVTNAYRASLKQENPEKRDIKIQLYQDSETLILSVQDNGPGGVTQDNIKKGNYGFELLLGLIEEDFGGNIVPYDAEPQGTQFIVNIPLSKIKV